MSLEVDKNSFGPTLKISEEIHQMKYRHTGETFYDAMTRISGALQDNPVHFKKFREILLDMRFLPAGRVQAAAGSPRRVTAFNCFVMGTIPDSMEGIMQTATEAAMTMRMGGGVGYDFSTLRPRGDNIVTIESKASGPVSFMEIYDALCKTIASAGHRRGAQMGVLRVDHPDIEEFIRSKQNRDRLTQFNISIGATDEFMNAVENDLDFDLKFDGRVYKRIHARALWDEIMRSTWEWAEPGILFIDRINDTNNLWYCENISATNPCAEQPLPPYGACLLGSFNLVRYVKLTTGGYEFDYEQYKADVPWVVRSMDNVIDRTVYPLRAQENEAKNKRRIGLGVTALANAGEMLGFEYGSPKFLKFEDMILSVLKNEIYRASALLAFEKGPFPLYDEKYLESKFVKTLDKDVIKLIKKHGIRNSHSTSIAPTGTISLSANNVSSGIEPVFSHSYDRTIQTFDGPIVETVTDYAFRETGVRGKTATECTADDHLNVLLVAYEHVDSAVSKTCNVSPSMPWQDFKDLYVRAWKGGAKGCTTFNPGGKRFGILNAAPRSEENEGAACYIDPATGNKSCG